MKVTLTAPYGKHARGETIEVADGIGATLVSSRRAVRFGEHGENKSMAGRKAEKIKRK